MKCPFNFPERLQN